MSDLRGSSVPILTTIEQAEEKSSAYHTVQYKDRFLYSRRNPSKNIISAIDRATILPNTLILVFSPCLFYGIDELKKKCGDNLGKNIFIVAVEADTALYDFSVENTKEKNTIFDDGTFFFPQKELNAQSINLFLKNLTSRAAKKIAPLPPAGTIRRVLRFDFSGGVSLNQKFYNEFFSLAQNSIAQYWKNRLTLIKLGNLYCKNIFKNLPASASSIQFASLEKSVARPILVLGAGESLEETIAALRQKPGTEKFFVIAVDAAALPIATAGIKIDAIATSEAQAAIEKAYIGLRPVLSNAAGITTPEPILFCDLTSRHTIARDINFKNSFFLSLFDDNNFIARFQEGGALPTVLPPLGSVGLVAVFIALLLRQSNEIPVCVAGLDFSFSLGKTHARGTMAHKARLLQQCRLSSIENFGECEKVSDKNKNKIFTTRNLASYAELFKDFFAGTKNLFSSQKGGIDLGLETTSLDDVLSIAPTQGNAHFNATTFDTTEKQAERLSRAKALLQNERKDLLKLADILTNGENSENRDKSLLYNEQILSLLQSREYLYLHFPDGEMPRTEQNFLTRVRTQIDFFLKLI